MNNKFVFDKINYQLMVVGLVFITFGVYLMAGTEDIFSTTKVTIAPIVVFVGLVIEIIAILYKPKQKA